MKQGLVIGKFMPLHNGHIALINFAAENCDKLIVLLGVLPGEPIPGLLRLDWLKQTFASNPKIQIEYTEEILPTAQESSREVSKAWAAFLKQKFPQTDILFSSEIYGSYLAEYMNISHKPFDPERKQISISASLVREKPFVCWDFIPPAVKPYFVKKICIYGPESTGKSVLTKRLAKHYKTTFVPEIARDIIDQQGLSENLIPIILENQAKAVLDAQGTANRLLFCDTDHLTTLIYSREFYNTTPEIPSWITESHQYDLYLFLDINSPWVEDYQRFFKLKRLEHRKIFLDELEIRGIDYEIIGGDWEERFVQAKKVIDEKFKLSSD